MPQHHPRPRTPRVTTALLIAAVTLSLLSGVGFGTALPAAAAGPPANCKGYVAITYDDGPHPTYTRQVLDHLKKYPGATAVFFPNGNKIPANAKLVARMQAEGHQVANHAWTHERLTEVYRKGGGRAVVESLQKTYDAAEAAGAQPVKVYRPPYGATSKAVQKASRAAGWVETRWTIDPQDFRAGRTSKFIVDHVVSRVKDQSNIVMHDRLAATAGAVPGLIKGVWAKGLCFGHFDPDTGRIVAVESLAPCEPTAAEPFCDATNSQFSTEISWMASQGHSKGCNPPANDRFCPKSEVTRGQMAAFLARALKLAAGEKTFADTRGHTFQADIAALERAGITRGCNPPTNTRFCPDQPVTRGQMAAFLARALNLTPGTKEFTDTRGHTFQADIAALERAGITRGCNPPTNTRFCPDQAVTREQMAAFLYRALRTIPNN